MRHLPRGCLLLPGALPPRLDSHPKSLLPLVKCLALLPNSWTRIAFTNNPAFTELMLLRSSPAPLNMWIPDRWKHNLNEIRNLGLQCRRCHTLSVPHFALFTILPQFNGSTTLKFFKLSGTGGDLEVVPRDLIQSLLRCPVLTHLEISDCVLSMEKFPAIPTLKTLKLVSLGKQKRGSIKALHKALSSMPELEVLELKKVFHMHPQPSTILGPRAVLARLKDLKVTNYTIGPISAFLSLITIPSTAIIAVDVSGHDVNKEQALLEFMPALGTVCDDTRSSICTAGALKVAAIRLERLASGTSIRICFWADATSMEDGEQPEMVLAIPSVPIPFLQAKLQGAFWMTDIRWLSVDDWVKVDQAEWTSLASLATLVKITFSGDTSIHAFLLAMTSQDVPLPNPPPFPALRELAFDYVRFNDPSIPDRILDAIKARPMAYRLTKLRIKRPQKFRVDILQRLRELVDVDWEESPINGIC